MDPPGEPLTLRDRFPRWVRSEEFHLGFKTRSNVSVVSAVRTDLTHENVLFELEGNETVTSPPSV